MNKVVAIYPLLEYKTGKESGLYTSTCFDLYIDKNKKKYVRGHVQLFSNVNSPLFTPFNKIPAIIEQVDYEDWKCSYNHKIQRDDLRLVNAYMSKQLTRD